jgi:hypothetical protein
MFNFGTSNRRKNTKAVRARKLKAKIAKKMKKLNQDAELKKLQKQWETIRSK